MRLVLLMVSLLLLAVSTVLSLSKAVSEDLVYNIVYVHVPASISALVCFTVVFVCSIVCLIRYRPLWDHVAAASAEVGLLFAVSLNVTGSIWAHAAWGVWWTISPRLVSSAMLLFLYAAYVLLRNSFSERIKRARVAAVFGIIAFIDVPLVYISARFVEDIHRPSAGFETGWQSATFGVAILGTLLLAAGLIWLRTEMFESRMQMDEMV